MTLINAVRGHLAEFGIIAPAGPQQMKRLIERLADPATPIPASVRALLDVLADQLVPISRQIQRMETQMRRRCQEQEESARLLTIPGVGPITVRQLYTLQTRRRFGTVGSSKRE